MARIIRYSQITIAYFCLILGLAGLVLPIIPGWIFIFIGLDILVRQQPDNLIVVKFDAKRQSISRKLKNWRQPML
ncbi:MAG TPA: hypothetical protein PKN62_03375 [bacterium]|nr:hypothetical protein [bacterium]